MANIAIAKLSKSIRFDSTKWSPIGGDNEAPFLVYALAKAFPEDTFWIIGKSDYSKVFPNGLLPNIKDIWSSEYWDGYNPTNLVRNKTYDDYPENYETFYKYINTAFKKLGVNIDFAFMLYGMFFSCSLFNVVLRGDGNGYTKTLENATQYMSFLTYWLNTYEGNYASIITDPRQYRVFPRDLVHWPSINLSQIDKDMKFSSKSSQYWPKGNLITNPQVYHKNVYSGVETLNLLSRVPYDEFPEKHGFNMILNQGYPGDNKHEPPRYTLLKQWVLSDKDFMCSIYGKWDDKILESDKRFKGPISPVDLGTVLETTKYTLCIPIAPGWVTSKFVEMAHYGVMPFVTDTYGSESSQTYIPDVLRVKTREELKQRIELFEQNPDAYKKVMDYLKTILKNMYTGEYALTNICDNISKYTNFAFGAPVKLDKPIALLYKEDEENARKQAINNKSMVSEIDELF